MVHQQINFMLEINTHGVIPANTYRDVGGRATHDYRDIGGRVTPGAVTEEAKAEAGTQFKDAPPKSLHWTPIQWRTLLLDTGSSPV